MNPLAINNPFYFGIDAPNFVGVGATASEQADTANADLTTQGGASADHSAPPAGDAPKSNWMWWVGGAVVVGGLAALIAYARK